MRGDSNGYFSSKRGDHIKRAPKPVRGGRIKTIYKITKKGKTSLEETLRMHEHILNSIPSLDSGK